MKIYYFKINQLFISQFLSLMVIRESITKYSTQASYVFASTSNEIKNNMDLPQSQCLNIHYIGRNSQDLFQSISFKFYLKNCISLGEVGRKDADILYSERYEAPIKNQELIIELRYRPFNGLPHTITNAEIVSPSIADYLYDNAIDSSEENAQSMNVGYGRLLDLMKIELAYLNTTVNFAKFECWKLIRPGFYGIRIRKADNRTTINEINWLKFNETTSTKIKPLTLWLRNDSIFPSCMNELTLSFSFPQSCDTAKLHDVLDFRIRIYASAIPSEADTGYPPFHNNNNRLQDKQRQNEPFHADSSTVTRNNYDNKDGAGWIYMGELAIKNVSTTGTSLLTIPCVNFDIIHEQFCFDLISIERITRHFEHWDRKCVSTEPEVSAGLIAESTSDLAIGSSSAWEQSSWSEWTEWTSCMWRPFEKEQRNNENQKIHCQFPTKFNGKFDTSTRSDPNSRLGFRKRHRECILSPNLSSPKMITYKSQNICGKGALIQRECCEILKDSTTSDPYYRNQSNESDAQAKISEFENNKTLFASDKPESGESVRQSTINCECGCKLSKLFGSSLKGTFFIGSEVCKPTVITWEFLLQTESEDKHLVELRIIARAKSHKFATLQIFHDDGLIWTSKPSNPTIMPESRVILLAEELAKNERIIFKFASKDDSARKTKQRRGGFYVEIQIYNDSLAKLKLLSSHTTSISTLMLSPLRLLVESILLKWNILDKCNSSMVAGYSDTTLPSTTSSPSSKIVSPSTQQNCDDILMTLTLVFAIITVFLLLFVPSVVCVFLTRRFAAKNWSQYCKQHSSLSVPFVNTVTNSANDELILSSDRHSSEMLHSHETDSTQITEYKVGLNKVDQFKNLGKVHQCLTEIIPNVENEEKFVSKRSIGIQLSRQSTPMLTSRNNNEKNDFNNNKSWKKRRKERGTPLSPTEVVAFNRTGSTASNSAAQTTIDGFGEEEDGVEYGTESGTDGFEYDYYEPPHPPSSFLRPQTLRFPRTEVGIEQVFELVSEIDIDEIVRNEAATINEKWHKGAKWLGYERVGMKTQDAHTQISDSI